MTDSQDELNDDAALEEAERFEEARTDALADSHEEGEPTGRVAELKEAAEAAQQEYLDAIAVEAGGQEPEGTGYVDAEGQVEGEDYPVAHVVDLEIDQTTSMCGEKIEGDLQGDRVLAYTCTACQVAMTERHNALADALLEAQLRLRIITQTSIGGTRGGELNTAWTRRVREVAADAQDAILEQLDSGPRNGR